MKPWLVDVPVKINIWIRPELQKKQWEVIKQVRPKILFIQSDGGRNDEEWAAIKQNRELIDNGIDWDCEVHRLYENENLGLYTMGAKRNKYIWEHVDRCIFLEDDHIPSISYFRFCSELLEKYKDDQRVEAICGFNNVNQWNVGEADYFFATNGAIWGISTWRNRVDETFLEKYKKNKYFIKSIKYLEHTDYNTASIIRGYIKDPFYNNHPPGGEFWHWFNCFAHHRLFIVPSKNMITCEGATNNSAHSCDYERLPDYLKKLFFSKRYELSFPIRHPDFCFDDEDYDRAVEESLGRLSGEKHIHNTTPFIKRVFHFLREGHYLKKIKAHFSIKKTKHNRLVEK